jgi:hypothetical protein
LLYLGTAAPLPAGATWTATVVMADGTTYTSKTTTPGSYSVVPFYFTTQNGTIGALKSLKLQFTIPAGTPAGSFTINWLNDNLNVGGGCGGPC